MDPSGVREIQAKLAESIRPFIGSTKTLTPAVLLLMQFSDTAAVHFSAEKLMGRLVAQGQSRLAEEWAKSPRAIAFRCCPLLACNVPRCPGAIMPVKCTHQHTLTDSLLSQHRSDCRIPSHNAVSCGR